MKKLLLISALFFFSCTKQDVKFETKGKSGYILIEAVDQDGTITQSEIKKYHGELLCNTRVEKESD